jgi:FkbM family methyltransferase
MGYLIKRIFERFTGYWLYKARHLPIGTDLRVDFDRLGFRPHVMFDIGANNGQTYKRFRRDFPTARIYSFEPVKSTFADLRRLIADDSEAVAEQLAVGEIPGESTIYTHTQWSVGNSLRNDLEPGDGSEQVAVTTLDSYGVDQIDLLKIDTEGFELPVLRGGMALIRRGAIRAIFTEVGFDREDRRHTCVADVSELLSSHNYVFYALYDVTHHPGTPAFANALFLHQSLLSRLA